VGKLEGKGPLEDVEINVRITLERQCGPDSCGSGQGSVNMVINHRVP